MQRDIVQADIVHGGSLAGARRLFPGAREPIVDLSTGINPVAWPVPGLDASVWTRLPEPEAVAGLEAVAAAAYGGQPAQVTGASGTQILISLMPRLVPSTSVAVVGPTYGEHAVAWRAAGAMVGEVGSLAEARGADTVVLCNPNNPDGRRHDPHHLATLALKLAARGGLLVVDEAFADLEDGPLSLIPMLPESGAVVLRSFGKTYGLAGLRLGFAVAGESLASGIRQALGPWAVSGPAVAIGTAALADAEWRAAARLHLTTECLRLDGLLEGAGLKVVGGTRLFRLAEADTAPAIFERLGRAGIFVRRFERHPARLRFGLPGDEAAWERIEAALA